MFKIYVGLLWRCDHLLRDLYTEYGLDMPEHLCRELRETREELWKVLEPTTEIVDELGKPVPLVEKK